MLEPQQGEAPDSLVARTSVGVARYPESRGRAWGIIGLLAGFVPLAVAIAFDLPALGVAAMIGFAVIGVRLGRRHPAWYCARCNAFLRPEQSLCHGCGAPIGRSLARAADRLDQPEPSPGGRLAAAPYRDGGLGLDFAEGELDGSALEQVQGVLQPSSAREPLTGDEIDRLQRTHDVVLSRRHVAYLATLGPGVDSDIVELWSPARIVAERRAGLVWLAARRWDADERLTDLEIEASVVIGQTDEGDRLAVHPSLPGRLLWLRADVQEIVDCGAEFDQALDEICGLPPDRRRWFAPPSLQPRSTIDAGTDDLRDVLRRILEYGPVCLQREHDETDDDESWLVLAPGIGGWVRLQRAPGRSWSAVIACDVRSIDAARRLTATLAR